MYANSRNQYRLGVRVASALTMIKFGALRLHVGLTLASLLVYYKRKRGVIMRLATTRTYITNHPLSCCLILYAVCYAVRMWEYLVLRTDQGAIGESLVHKLFGIVAIFAMLRLLQLRWRDIGFRPQHWLKQIMLGLGLGAVFYTVVIGAELLILQIQGAQPALLIAEGSFSLTRANEFVGVGLGFIILFNLFNVWMEEGLFRGLFTKLLSSKYTVAITMGISALLFGLWHLAMPVRAFLDGELQLVPMILLGIGYVLFSFVYGLKMSLLYRMTGGLWVCMADHFFNNTIINVLHVVSSQGSDNLQLVRIVSAQFLSFAAVYAVYRYGKKRGKWQSKENSSNEK